MPIFRPPPSLDLHGLYHMLRLEVLHPKLLSFARDGPLPLMWNNLTTRSKPLQPDELEAVTGRTALIVGATSGVGLEVAKIFAAHCSRLIITARDPDRGEQALEEIRASHSDEKGSAEIEIWPLDMESFRSIREFSQRLQDDLPSLDIAVLNAGVWNVQFTRSIDENETHLQVNYLASCALSIAVLDLLGRGDSTSAGRLLTVTSEGHSLEEIPPWKRASDVLQSFNDPAALTCYERYRLSKLLSMLWTHELAALINSSNRAVEGSSRRVEIASFTPGATQTQICRDLGAGRVVRLLVRLFCQSAEEGAWTYVRALASEVYSGLYFFRGRPSDPADCVTSIKHRYFREDLVKETLAMLEGHVVVPDGVREMLSGC
ncbi:hypothetical protein BJX68DRAFT_267045 [Aspergillus pseudodeflectus]|uniref:NAD(P)-binding protein n=1 Tax=Aspergillus pseudodeflectus TaxID=176178 RepID=A0ABR4KC48_9EURO